MQAKPLSGKKILVTRPAAQAGELIRSLENVGAEVVHIPLIRITPPASWYEFDQAAKDIDSFAWIIFASSNAVNSTIARLKSQGIEISKNRTKVACIGDSTKRALAEHGISCDFTPEKFVAESFVESFPLSENGNKKILWAKTNIGRQLIKDELQKSGWDVHLVETYNTCGPEDLNETSELILQHLNSTGFDAITLASPETVSNLHSALTYKTNSDPQAHLQNAKLICIGPATESACKSIFGRCDGSAKTYTAAGLLEAVIATLSKD